MTRPAPSLSAGMATISPAPPTRWRPGPSAAAARCCSWACPGRRSSRRPGRSTPSASRVRRGRWRRRRRPSSSTRPAASSPRRAWRSCTTNAARPSTARRMSAISAPRCGRCGGIFRIRWCRLSAGNPISAAIACSERCSPRPAPAATVYRIDRHPTMSVHPVTPMGEADLRKHFAKQGLERIGLIDYRAYESCKAAASLDACLATQAGRGSVRCRSRRGFAGHRPRSSCGTQRKARCLSSAQARSRRRCAPPADEVAGDDGAARRRDAARARRARCSRSSGSLSPVTRAQVSAARGYARIDVDPARLIGDTSYSKALHEKTRDLLRAQHVMLVTDAAVRIAGASAGGRGCDRLAVAGGHGGRRGSPA